MAYRHYHSPATVGLAIRVRREFLATRPSDLSLSAGKHVDALPVDNGALPPDLPCASDFGVASAVEMSKGQAVTVVDADSASRRWLGFETRIADSRFFPICRTQLNLAIKPLDHPFAFSTAA